MVQYSVFSHSIWKTVLKTLLIILIGAYVFFQEAAATRGKL